MFEKILVPLDGSEHSRRALETAVQVAQRFDGRLTLMHVYSVGGLAASPESMREFIRIIRKAGARILEEEEEKVKAKGFRWRRC
ncbi:MAG: universal stress protein [Candidatus Bathyarchaeia archaeon]